MKIMKCEMCESTEFAKVEGMWVCQHCGCKYTPDEAKKLMVEGTVKIDKSSETEKLLILARRAKEDGNDANAEKYYSEVLVNDPENWEAHFFQVYFTSMQTKIGTIASAANRLSNCLSSTFELISKLENDEEKISAVKDVVIHSTAMAEVLSSAAARHYHEFNTVSGAESEYNSRLNACLSIYQILEKELILFSSNDEITNIKTQVRKDEDKWLYNYRTRYKKEWLTQQRNRLKEEILKVDPTYVQQEIPSGGCYVATCVYGSYDCPEVWTLRRFRDYELANTWYGRTFIKIYYAISPTIVKLFGETDWFKNMWQGTLDNMVKNLQDKGYESTPYDDLPW